MGSQGKITVDLEARSAGWTAGLGKAGGDVKAFVRNAERDFKNLTLQNGASGFAGTFQKLSKGAEEVATSIRTGGSAASAFGQAVNGIPIVGQFKQAGESIKELIHGTAAHRIQLEKFNESLNVTLAIYHSIAQADRIRGTRGDERAKISIDQGIDGQMAALNAQKVELENKRADVDRRFGTKFGYTDAQKEEIRQLDDQAKAINAKRSSLRKDGDSQQKMQTEDSAQRQLEFRRANDELVADGEAEMQEKSLRRQGKALESAIVGVNRKFAAQKVALEAQLDPLKLAGLSDGDKNERISRTHKAEEQLSVAHGNAITDLIFEQGRKESEIARANQEEVTKITAEANIKRLQSLGRNKEAEAATIEENYRAEIAKLETKNREENHLMETNKNDPTLKAAEQAEGLKRRFALEDASIKGRQEDMKQERSLWEQNGDAMEKYAAKLAGINEDFEKLHDARLRDAQIKKLDVETLQSLKQTDHSTKIDLYGRTGGYRHVKTGDGADTGAQQLAAIKEAVKQLQAWSQFYDVAYNYVRQLKNGSAFADSSGGD